MRPVAVVALLVILAYVPTPVRADLPDECASAGAGMCITVQSGQPGGPTFYVYDAALLCAPTFNPHCTGHPFPTGSKPPVGFAGLVYQETNSQNGLQRFDVYSGGKLVPGDKPLLL